MGSKAEKAECMGRRFAYMRSNRKVSATSRTTSMAAVVYAAWRGRIMARGGLVRWAQGRESETQEGGVVCMGILEQRFGSSGGSKACGRWCSWMLSKKWYDSSELPWQSHKQASSLKACFGTRAAVEREDKESEGSLL